MKTRAAVAFEAGKPLEVVEVELEGPKEGEVLVIRNEDLFHFAHGRSVVCSARGDETLLSGANYGRPPLTSALVVEHGRGLRSGQALDPGYDVLCGQLIVIANQIAICACLCCLCGTWWYTPTWFCRYL